MSMHFASVPSNDFAEFIETYFKRCQARVPAIEGSAGKWTFEDLIPGLSDFDTRFLVADTMTVDDWCWMSSEVGRVHLELAEERKEWARNLEHLPGVNLKWDELLDERLYFTEFSQWSFYQGPEARLAETRRLVADHRWTAADEQYHWKKIAIYYGPYNRTIDPPVNLGRYENKYPLHSRLMHYMAPPIHSAVCLMQRETTPGKLDAFRAARDLFPDAATMDLILELIDRHYEAPGYLAEPGLSELDARLEVYLRGVVNILLEASSLIDCPRNATVQQLKEAVRAVDSGPSFAQLFEGIKFSRLMKGRLWFYGQKVLWFDSEFLIRNELNRIRANFYETPLRLYAKLAYDADVSAERALEMLQGDVFTPEDVAACHRFAAISGPECPDAELKNRALQIADIFDPYLHAIDRLLSCAQTRFLPGSG